jgi:hypothetical protein
MPNNRIYYASQTAQLRPQDAEGTNKFAHWYQPLGLQSVGMNTTFNLEQAFQLGTVELYENIENVPNVEVTMNKVIDNTAPLYAMCMGGAGGVDAAFGQDLGSLVNNRVNFRLGIFEDNKQFVSSTAKSHVVCSGMYLSRLNYTLPIDGNGSEEVTLVGNHKIWNTGAFLGQASYTFSASTIFNPTTVVDGITPTNTSGIVTRQYVNIINSVLPVGSGGIKRPNSAGGGQTGATSLPHFQSITVSADLGRENINELGKFSPYCRYTTFPIEVTSEFQVVSPDGDYVDAKDFYLQEFCGQSKTNLKKHDIRIHLNSSNSANSCSQGMILDLGNKNVLTSVNHTGGDTGGGNVTVTYSFRNFNNFKINASGTYSNGIAIAVADGSLSALDYSDDSQPRETVQPSYNSQPDDVSALKTENIDSNYYGDTDNV